MEQALAREEKRNSSGLFYPKNAVPLGDAFFIYRT